MNSTRRVLSLQVLQAKQLDPDNQHYLLTPFPPSPPSRELRESIHRFGILNPALVKKKAGKYIVVSGRKRLTAAIEQQDNAEFSCLVFAPSTPEVTVFTTLLEHAMLSAPLTVVEQAFFFRKLLRHCDENRAATLLPAMGHKAHPFRITKLLELLQLSRPSLLALHTGIITQQSARMIMSLKPEEQKTLVAVIRSLRLGGSKQKKMIGMVLELSRRHAASPDDVLADAGYGSDEVTAAENRPQLAAALLRQLSRLCFPRLQRAEEDFQSFRRSLRMPRSTTLSHSPAFEDDTLTLSIRFENRGELQKKWDFIRPILGEKHGEKSG